MATKYNCPCLDKSHDDEPIFVLCARDLTADFAVEMWIAQNVARLREDHPKIVDARRVMLAMQEWPRRRLPD